MYIRLIGGPLNNKEIEVSSAKVGETLMIPWGPLTEPVELNQRELTAYVPSYNILKYRVAHELLEAHYED